MAGNSMRIGSVEIVSVPDRLFACPLNVGSPGVSADRWREVEPSIAEAGLARRTIGTFVVRTPRQTLLIDSGIGPAGAPGFGIGPGRLPDALREAGVALDDIQTVVITHLHVDHVDWNAQERDGRFVTHEALFQRIQEMGARVAAGHFPPPGFGRIVVVEGKRMWQGV